MVQDIMLSALVVHFGFVKARGFPRHGFLFLGCISGGPVWECKVAFLPDP